MLYKRSLECKTWQAQPEAYSLASVLETALYHFLALSMNHTNKCEKCEAQVPRTRGYISPLPTKDSFYNDKIHRKQQILTQKKQRLNVINENGCFSLMA